MADLGNELRNASCIPAVLLSKMPAQVLRKGRVLTMEPTKIQLK